MAVLAIGLYGGSFDPIHNGHLLLAREAREQLGLETVIFLPARISPHKQNRPPTDGKLRAEMIATAIAGEKGFELDTREMQRKEPSYTIDTVREFLAEGPTVQFHYLIGEDSLAELHTWKEADVLVSLVKFVVLTRSGTALQPAMLPLFGSHQPTVVARQIEISSTEIRQRAARKASLRYLLPDSVATIIHKHQLYCH